MVTASTVAIDMVEITDKRAAHDGPMHVDSDSMHSRYSDHATKIPCTRRRTTCIHRGPPCTRHSENDYSMYTHGGGAATAITVAIDMVGIADKRETHVDSDSVHSRQSDHATESSMHKAANDVHSTRSIVYVAQ